jgi:hypothetical protein
VTARHQTNVRNARHSFSSCADNGNKYGSAAFCSGSSHGQLAAGQQTQHHSGTTTNTTSVQFLSQTGVFKSDIPSNLSEQSTANGDPSQEAAGFHHQVQSRGPLRGWYVMEQDCGVLNHKTVCLNRNCRTREGNPRSSGIRGAVSTLRSFHHLMDQRRLATAVQPHKSAAKYV